MIEQDFLEVSSGDTPKLIAEIAPAISPVVLSPNDTLVEVAKLPFYGDFKLYALTDLRLSTQNVHYVLYKPGFASLLDGTEESISRVNERASLKFDADTLPAYVEFFFAFVDRLGDRFTIVKELEDVELLPDATEKEKSEVAAELMPVACKGAGDDGLFSLTCTLLSRDELFRTEIKVAPREMDVPDPKSGASEHMTAGQVKMARTELLLWGLKVSDEELEEVVEDYSDDDSETGNCTAAFCDTLPLDGLAFREISGEEANSLLEEIASEIEPITLPGDKTSIRAADLSFYDEYKLYEFTDPTISSPNILNVLYKPGSVIPMNGTNEPVYTTNELAPVRLEPDTFISYVKFFFHYVYGELGRFKIVEKPEDVVWLPKAKSKEKEKVNAKLMPLTYNGVDSGGLHTFTGTVLFRNALFRTDIKVAPEEMDAPDHELGGMEHFTIGQLKLTGEDLLFEDLHVPVDSNAEIN
ncbi:MAG: hypothetical protein ACP5SH_17175 [Syntrophobacteraceae bacterium]